MDTLKTSAVDRNFRAISSTSPLKSRAVDIKKLIFDDSP